MRDRRALVALLAVLAAGLALLVASGLERVDRPRQTLGAQPVTPLAELEPGAEVCQRPVPLAEPVDRVEVVASPEDGVNRSPIAIRLVDLDTTRTVASARAPGGGRSDLRRVRVEPVPAGTRVAVCVRNLGPQDTLLWGDARSPTADSSAATLDGEPLAGDITLRFPDDGREPRIAAVPAVVRHASAWRPDALGTGAWILAGLAVLAGVPALLGWALRRADD